MNEGMNQSISYEGVCRTAPATQGLLIIQTSARATLAGAAASIYLVIPSIPDFFDMVWIGSICTTFYFLIRFIVCLHISNKHLQMIIRVLYTLLAPY